jgi:DnaJ family protein C protein 9
VDDLKAAYMETGGSIGEIMNHVPHSTNDDEPRFIMLISDLIAKGDLPSLPTWESSIKDEKSRLVRKKQSQKEAQEAEGLAKELGVWDEFYGSGKTTEKKAKGKGKEANAEEDDYSALQALMLKRKKQDVDGFFDSLAAKYADPASKGKSKGGGTESPKKKSRRDASPPPEMDDEEFENLQNKLFGDKSKPKAGQAKSKKERKGRKVK